MEKSEVLLEEATKSLKNDSPNSALLSAYAAMLCIARAVLFKDGYREKSHACVAGYLEAKYSKEIGSSFICLFDEYREKRHKTMYSGDYYPTMEEARRTVSFAKEFITKIKNILKNQK
jgi:uncharacterized protein (UPF0332 family)